MTHLRVVLAGLVVMAALVVSGCGGGRTVTVTVAATTASAAASIPAAPIALGVPAGYRTKQVWHAELSGQSVPDVVVASVGPPVTSLNFHSMDLRVLEWDPLAHRWGVAFDAQKVTPPSVSGDPGSSNSGPGYYAGVGGSFKPPPLLDPKADVGLGSVRFVKLLSGRRHQLAFDASANYGGSGVPDVLAVVDFKNGLANLAYTWSGEGLMGWRVSNRVLSARAEYWTPADAHCCPVGTYDFTIANKQGYLLERSDSRPWLGVTVHELSTTQGTMGPLQVTEFADKAPAAGRLRVGDVLLNVLNAPPPPKNFQGSATSSIFDKLVLLHAGQTARLLVDRGGVRIVVSLPLGSMRDSFGQFLPANDYTAAAL